MKRRTNNQAGFTLIELLIVIAIIGILASVVMVSLSRGKEKAKVGSFKSQVSSMQSAALLTCNDAELDEANVLAPEASGGQVSYIGTIGPDFDTQDCGLEGDTTFSFTVASTGLQEDCTATVEDTGVQFSGC